jgi:SAM-dependent methyltransferase
MISVAGPATPLLGLLRGTVLELGPGWGAGLAHYAPDVRWIGVEPDAAHRAHLRLVAARLDRPVRLLPGRAERLDLPDASVDAAVATFVLCSVTDQRAALAELLRVLRPGGRFVFAEHVAAPSGTWLRRAQHAAALAGRAFGTRCAPDRPGRRGAGCERSCGSGVTEVHGTVASHLPGQGGIAASGPALLYPDSPGGRKSG